MNDTVAARRLTRKLDDGTFAVLSFAIERTNHTYIAWSVDIYRSEQAYRDGEGAQGGTREASEARVLFPDVDPKFFDLHLADAGTGTPMHAKANSLYYLSGEWAAHAREQVLKAETDKYGTYHGELLYEGEGGEDRRRYVKSIEEWDALDIHAIEDRRASRILGVEIPADLRQYDEVEDPESGETVRFFDKTATKRAAEGFVDGLVGGWQDAANRLRAWIEEEPAGDEPADDKDIREFERELADGLHVKARHADNSEGVHGGLRHRYEVTVTYGEHTYTASAWGSLADYEEDRYDARQMAFMVLDEMLSAVNDPDEFAALMGDSPSAQQVRMMASLLDAVPNFEDALEANAETISAYR